MKHITLFFSLALLLWACTDKNVHSEQTAISESIDTASVGSFVQLTEQQYANAGLQLGHPQLRPTGQLLKVNGTVEVPAQNHHTISFPMGGYFRSSPLIPGMTVRKGQLLATLEDASFIQLQQDYLLSRARLQFAQADFYRQEELSKTQSNSQKAYQQARAEFESLRVAVRAGAERLRLVGINPDRLTEQNITRVVSLYAPASGIVSAVHVNPGKFVAPTDVLFEIMDPSNLHVQLTVFEKDAAGIRKGQRVWCSSNLQPDKKIPAVVELITPAIGKDWMKLEILMSHTRSFSAYRLAWDNSSAERIPYIPLHRRDLVTAEEGNRTFIGDERTGRINWKKFEVMGEVIVGL
ncbi:MAG: HlyD family efflux transporter periplasmic adaptor subunit, partial [Sphingobacteriales bacterium]